MRRVVVGFSGGVSSAWCAGWALQNFPREEVVFLFHDTREEDPDTYRFIREMADRLGHSVTERSDGRSVVEVFEDQNAIANNRMAFCSRILKAEQRDRFFKELRRAGVIDIVNVLGFSAVEWQRVSRATARAESSGYSVRFPLIEQNVSKQAAADWCVELGVRPPSMYLWSEHANCVGCVRGGEGILASCRQTRARCIRGAGSARGGVRSHDFEGYDAQELGAGRAKASNPTSRGHRHRCV